MSAAPLDEAALTRFRQAALVGTGPGGESGLTTLAWLAARSRFARPQPPAFAEGAAWPSDPRAIVPDAARQPMLSLLSGKEARGDGPMARQLARELRSRRLRPHPFDLKRLDSFVVAHAANLGHMTQAWLGAVRPTTNAHELYDEVDELTEAGFPAATRAQKIAFVRAMRATDPAAARTLVQARLGEENAQVRGGLVSALAVGLGRDDQALLESLAEDRAQSVRDEAAALLARVPGTAAYEKKRSEALDLIEVKTSGLFRKTRTLSIRKSATLPPDRLSTAVYLTLQRVTLDDLARTFGMQVSAFVVAAAADWRVARPVLTRAAIEARPDLVARLIEALDAPDVVELIDVIAPAFEALAPAEREALVAVTVRPHSWATLAPHHGLYTLHARLEGTLPRPIAADLLGCKAWAATLAQWQAGEDRFAAYSLEAVAALVPADLSQAFLKAVEPLPPAITHYPALYHRCLLALGEPVLGDPR